MSGTKSYAQELLVFLALLLCFTAYAFFTREKPLDYAKPENWVCYGSGEEKPADLFLLAPMLDAAEADNANADITNEATRQRFIAALNMQRGLYEEQAVIYAPYYRQSMLPAASAAESGASKAAYDMAYADVRAAFLHYLKVSDPERPLLLAGFSQGAQMMLRIFEEFFRDESLQRQLVAIYCIGCPVLEADCARISWLKMAQGEADTGVVVSFCSEAPALKESSVLPRGAHTLGINPLNWKTDSTPAAREENPGSCFPNSEGVFTAELPQLTGAYLDPLRGTLKLPDIDPAQYTSPGAALGDYHFYDYQFFYRALRQNVKTRVSAYLAQRTQTAAKAA